MWLMSLLSLLSYSSRASFRKSVGLLFVCISLLIMSWESQKVDAALLNTAIPDESIRLRILANSDSPQDQAIKMLVRDRVVEHMNSWATEASSIDDARLIVEAHLDELKQAVADVLAENKQSYDFNVTLSIVDFPTKSYGNIVYPGGDYEALLVTLGEAQGRNWWCVLFPPLCFVDTVSGEASPKKMKLESKTSEVVKSEDEKQLEQASVDIEASEADVEVKFFLADAWSWLKGLFS